MSSTSRLDIILGSMFSGKTSALLRKLTQFGELGLKAVYINHSTDNRNPDKSQAFSTHSPLFNKKLEIDTLKMTLLPITLAKELDDYDIIGIDEAQFFGNELVDFVLELVDNMKKYVIVVGLDGDYRRKKFGNILELIPYSTNVHKLHAYCKRCIVGGRGVQRAIFTCYTSSSTPTIGGAECYEAVCRDCFLR